MPRQRLPLVLAGLVLAGLVLAGLVLLWVRAFFGGAAAPASNDQGGRGDVATAVPAATSAPVGSATAEGSGVYVIDADGGGRTHLVPNLPDAIHPVWSPDDRRLAFLRNSTLRLHVVNADGSGLRRPSDLAVDGTPGAVPPDAVPPSWSPDGTRLLVVSGEALYALQADGTGVAKVTDRVTPGPPSWSPDGTRIAFLARPEGESGTDIYLVNPDGYGRTRLTDAPGAGDVGRPVWSPDGTRVAFASAGGVSVVNRDGSGRRRVFKAPSGALDFSWSPDGTELLVVKYLGDGYTANAYQVHRQAIGAAASTLLVEGGVTAVWSPDGRKIAYGTFHGDVKVMNPDGSEPVRLARGTAPSWSPDGSRIAFTVPDLGAAVPGGTEDGADGGLVTAVEETPTPTPSGGTYGAGTYAETGGYGAYRGGDIASGCGTPVPTPTQPAPTPTGPAQTAPTRTPTPPPGGAATDGLYVVDADGSGLIRLRADVSASAWSPDGTKLAFAGGGGIAVIDADGTHPARVASVFAEPVWSPDGTKLAFVAPEERVVYVVGIDGAVVTKAPLLAPDAVGGAIGLAPQLPTWSPDGTRLAFVGSDGNGDELYAINADGSGRVQLTAFPAVQGGEGADDCGGQTGAVGAPIGPAWSPDGAKIAFGVRSTGERGADVGGVYLVNPDGSGQARLTHDPSFGEPAWSPDGTRLLFATSDGAVADLYRVDADGTDPTNLTGDHDGQIWQFAWSPDGARIAFVSDGDIWVMHADGTGKTRVAGTPLADASPAWSPDGAKIAFVALPYPYGE